MIATKHPIPARPASYDKKVALVLQGGGALGSYQGGVYAALAESPYLPDWVAGISIGAINAAIIAGNAPEQRVERLRLFWETITAPPSLWADWVETSLASFGDHRPAAALRALMLGQPGFFRPRPAAYWLFGESRVSFYETEALRGTLEALVDFDRINAREMRFSIGAVNLRTGNMVYFDNSETIIRAQHIMASGALPPGFPAVEIDGEMYWDGGLVSNTPLQYVVEKIPRRSRLCFQVDLFPARGTLPQTIEAVQEREKDIRYSSRTRAATDTLRLQHDLRHNINTLWDKLPPALRDTPEGRYLYNFGCVTTMDIVQLIHRSDAAQGQAKDYEFSRATMERRWAQGLADARQTLEASPWLAPMPAELGARTFDVAAAAKRAQTDPKEEADPPIVTPLKRRKTA
jgi:NTE family protein